MDLESAQEYQIPLGVDTGMS